MHQNLWPHFAATPDGDRERGIWPRHPNNTFHSYKVHSDWLQLLEEYGLIGLALFFVPFSFLCGFFGGRLRGEARRARGDGRSDMADALLLGGFLAMIAMIVHSIGDFNLQMPATTWVLAALLAIAIGLATDPPGGIEDSHA